MVAGVLDIEGRGGLQSSVAARKLISASVPQDCLRAVAAAAPGVPIVLDAGEASAGVEQKFSLNGLSRT